MKIVCQNRSHSDLFNLASFDEEDNPSPDIMVVELGPESVEQILRRIELFERVGVVDLDASELRFSFYGFECYRQEDLCEFDDGPFEEFKILPEGAERGWTEARLELQEIVVSPGNVVQFRCVQKHSDVPVMSPCIYGFKDWAMTQMAP